MRSHFEARVKTMADENFGQKRYNRSENDCQPRALEGSKEWIHIRALVYIIGILESRIGGSIFRIFPRLWEYNLLDGRI